MERGHYHEGVPAITVVVDGGWSKRAHKHSYNAKSGVAIIIGKETGKLLHIGVRNKYCAACAHNISTENHVCFRNWDASSSEMETDILLEGFLESERVHGVRYLLLHWGWRQFCTLDSPSKCTRLGVRYKEIRMCKPCLQVLPWSIGEAYAEQQLLQRKWRSYIGHEKAACQCSTLCHTDEE